MDRDQQAGAPIGTETRLVHRAGKSNAAGEAGKRDEPQEHEIRVTGPGKERNYISYALSLLEDAQKPFIVLSAMGSAINKSVSVAEIVKLRVPGLHQWSRIESRQSGDGRRTVSYMEITLSKNGEVFAVVPRPPSSFRFPWWAHGCGLAAQRRICEILNDLPAQHFAASSPAPSAPPLQDM